MPSTIPCACSESEEDQDPSYAASQAGGDGAPRLSKAHILMALALALAGLALVAVHFPEELESLTQDMKRSWWMTLLKAMIVVNAVLLAWRIWLVIRYRPARACADMDLPSLTVIVPAYNEGRQVLGTLRSVITGDYPAPKLQVICVDDGSRDDTWEWMLAAEKEFPGRVELVRQPVNRGKRRALYEGFRRATGDILVTIDSDSEVEPPTLRRLASVFVRDPRVGAAAGNVRVLNIREGAIPKMLDVAFTFSFDFIRAAQSRVNTVMCTPGALSAYDRKVVEPVLDQWLGQTFMGREANIGEDRAMTNLVLRQGKLVHFQSDAVVYTNVPVKYRGLCKMLLRWARSNIRETITLSRFAFTRFRNEPASGARVNLAAHWLKMTFGEVLKLSLPVSLLSWPLAAGFNLVLGLVAAALPSAIFFLLRRRSSDCLWAFAYTFYWLAALSWISLYALCTPHKNGWLTRQIKAAEPAAESTAALMDAQKAAPVLAASLPGEITAALMTRDDLARVQP